MTGGSPLLLMMLLVSSASFVIHVAALGAQWRHRGAGETERIAAEGYIRTAACRVLAAAIYTTAAAFQMAGARVYGGGLSPEALLIFTFVQILWISNAWADLRKRSELRRQAAPERRQP